MNCPLNSSELSALRCLTHGSARARIHPADAKKLVALGYARPTRDDMAITTLGLATLSSTLQDWPLLDAA